MHPIKTIKRSHSAKSSSFSKASVDFDIVSYSVSFGKIGINKSHLSSVKISSL